MCTHKQSGPQYPLKHHLIHQKLNISLLLGRGRDNCCDWAGHAQVKMECCVSIRHPRKDLAITNTQRWMPLVETANLGYIILYSTTLCLG